MQRILFEQGIGEVPKLLCVDREISSALADYKTMQRCSLSAHSPREMQQQYLIEICLVADDRKYLLLQLVRAGAQMPLLSQYR